MEAALEADHRRPLGEGPCELDRVLDRLRAGIEERRLRRTGDRRQGDEPLGKRHVRLVGDDREVGVHEARSLFLYRFDDVRIRVTDVEAADAAREVDEPVSVDVGERRAFAVVDHDRQEDRERVGDHALLPLEDLLRPWAGDPRLQLDRLGRRHWNGR